MAAVDYIDDVTGFEASARGSDNRLNVSARADARAYYNSRDRKQAYTFTYFCNEIAATEIGVAWMNNSTNLTLVISDITVNTDELAQVEAHMGIPTTLAGGTAPTLPVNDNFPSSNIAQAIVRQSVSGGDPVTGVASSRRIGFEQVGAGGDREFEFHDRIRLGQGQAIFLTYLLGTTGDMWGTMHGFYE